MKWSHGFILGIRGQLNTFYICYSIHQQLKVIVHTYVYTYIYAHIHTYILMNTHTHTYQLEMGDVFLPPEILLHPRPKTAEGIVSIHHHVDDGVNQST